MNLKRLSLKKKVKSSTLIAIMLLGCVALCVAYEPTAIAEQEDMVEVLSSPIVVADNLTEHSSSDTEPSEEEKLLLFIEEQANLYNLSPSLIKAVIQTESSFRADVENYNGTCIGLMQINKSTTSDWIAEQLGMTRYDLKNPYDNVRMGCFYLDYLRGLWLQEGYTDEEAFALMLISYNRGVGGCNKYISRHTNWYNNSYVREVLSYKITFEEGV